MSNWFEYFKAGLKKQAVDKLNEQELSGQFPPFTDGPPGQDPSMGAAMPPPPPDASVDPTMAEPLVWNNNYVVKPLANGPEFMVQLTPSIVTKPLDTSMLGGAMPPAAPADPMADTSLNPSADPDSLSQWMDQQNDGQDKPFSTQDPQTEDPLSREDDGLPPLQDVGNEKMLSPKVDVHKKKASPNVPPGGPLKTPGADHGNAYMPCAVCANYIAADNECSQGLDVEKVQAAKSCAWLNSNFSPFNMNKPDNSDPTHQDKDIVKNDVSELSGGGAGGGNAGSRFAAKKQNLKDYLKKLW
jgi:hypothetical protein